MLGYNSGMVAVSIVSHKQGGMVFELVKQLTQFDEVGQIIVTQNVEEDLSSLPRLGVDLIVNAQPKGYGSNHNAAFKYLGCSQDYFCILNPDIIFTENPFPELLECARSSGACLVAPRITDIEGKTSDTIRNFPSLIDLIDRLFRYRNCHEVSFDINSRSHFYWIGGMFMLFSVDSFLELSGFDERYFMYVEDVDVCARVWHSGRTIRFCPEVSVIHVGQRSSRRNIRHFVWHLTSIFRYFRKFGWCGPKFFRSQGDKLYG